MKLAPAIEGFIQYKQALGNLYTGSANVLKAFLKRQEISSWTLSQAYIARRSCQSKAAQLRTIGSIGTRCSTASSVMQPAAVTCSIECSPPRCLIDRCASFPIFIRPKISVSCWVYPIRITRGHVHCRPTPCAP